METRLQDKMQCEQDLVAVLSLLYAAYDVSNIGRRCGDVFVFQFVLISVELFVNDVCEIVRKL